MKERSIHTMLIANRGEIAVRVIRTCRELGIRSVAVYSDADRTLPHVLMADEARRIGPPPSRESYLAMDAILEAARSSGADAIHPGYGFLSENPEFARRVIEAGMLFVGPRPETIALMGDKTEARRLLKNSSVPLVPGTPGPVRSEREIRSFCDEHGYPVLLKAAAGGGGKGMRTIRKQDDIAEYFRAAQSEAKSAFGDDRVYLEKYLDRPRHVEFQIIADRAGNTVHLGERECSIQRRHQKVIEETPSTALTEELRTRMGAAAVAAAKACRYENAGTIEFLLDGKRNFYFLEMNTRLQVEHPVTELRTGLDIVALQCSIAEGKPLGLAQGDVHFRGHALECRIYAEDPAHGYLPSTGVLSCLRPSEGIGIREDRGIEQGNEVSVYYDPMIAKLIAWAPTRNEAIRRMVRALREYEISGVTTNIGLCQFVLEHPRFREGNFDTHFLQDEYLPGEGHRNGNPDRRAAAILCALLDDAKDGQPPPLDDNRGESGRKGWRLRRLDGLRS